MALNVGSVDDEKRYYGEVKISKAANPCNGHEAGRVGCYTRKGLRSSSSLRVVAIQTTDIFTKGCYL